MDLKLSKTMTCRVAAKGRWGSTAAAGMGLSFFLRMVYYFGLTNLRDVGAFELIFRVVLPLAVSVVFILMLKIPKQNSPIAAGVLAAAYAVNYFFAAQMSFAGVVSALLVLAAAVLLLGAALGYVPERKWVVWAGAAALAWRFLFVDLFGYVLPLTEWKIIAYIPECSNLFGVAAVSLLCPALRLRKQ